MLRKLSIALLILALSSVARAQTVATGLYSFGSFDNPGFDSIDRGSLNVHFAIPIVSKAGRGLPFSYALVYDGLIWSPTSASGSSAWSPDSTFGMHGYLLNDGYKGYLSYRTLVGSCLVANRALPFTYTSNPAYHDSFGAIHSFNFRLTYTCDSGGPVFTNSGNGAATDGSGYTFSSPNVITPQGQTLSLPQYVNGAPNTSNATISDANGNQVTNSTSGVFTDTTGTNVLTIAGTGTTSSPKVFSYVTYGTNPNGTTPPSASITMSYRTYTVQTSFGCSNIAEYNQTAGLIDRITLADGSYFQFAYEATPGSSTNVTGRLASITLPTGGVISYTYPPNPTLTVNCADGTPLAITRTTSDGEKTYYRSAITTTSSHTEIKDATGNFSEYDFVTAGSPASFYETLEATYAGAVSATPLLKRGTCYNAAARPCTTTQPTLPISQIDTYETADNIQQRGSTSFFNSFGLQTERDDYDYGGASARGSLLRRELWGYPSSGIANLLVYDLVYDAAGTIVSKESYLYDGSGVTGTSGLPQHAGTVGSQRGNLTSVSDYLNTSNSTIQVQANTYDDAGQVLSTTGIAGGVTKFGYDPTDTFVTAVTLPATNNGVALTGGASYDVASGVLLSATDANGEVTSYGNYDALNRAQQITYADGGHLYLTYSPTEIIQSHDIDTSSARVITYTQYDGYARLSRTAVFNGQGTSPYYQVDSCYDGNGRLSFQPVPYQDAGFSAAKRCSGAGDTTTYDALGRATKVAHADGSAATYAYTGRATQTVDEIGVTRIQQVDGLGRLTATCEVSSNASMPSSGAPQACGMDIAGTGFLTTYANGLASHQVTTAQGAQTRIFQTDSLGRIILTQEPEMSTASGQGKTTYSYAYSGGELAVTRTKPLQNQTSPTVLATKVLTFDVLGRLRFVHYTDGFTPDALYQHDISDGLHSQSLLKGRLSYANTGNAQTVYNYDQVGRPLTLWECQPSGCFTAAKFRELDFTYDHAGRELSQADPTAGVINYAYTPAGEVTGITNTGYNNATNPGTLLSAVVNGPAGPTSYKLGNGLTGVRQYDASNRPQYGWLCAGGVITAVCSGGTQIYGENSAWRGNYVTDSVDTIVNTGGHYTYDEFGRLKSFASSLGTPTTFNWTYDRWGNRWSQTPGDSVTFNTSSNQKMDGSTVYDADGDIIQDAQHTYSYDAEGNLLSVDGGKTASYVYDALNQRVQVNVPGAATPVMEFTYDVAGRRVTTWDANANFGIQGQEWWGNTPIAYRGAKGNTYFEQADWEGTQRILTDYAGNLLSQYKSNPFGDGYSASGQDDNSLHYGYLEHDAVSGSEHAQFRQYDSAVGIWMRPDPYLGSYDLTNPQSLNRYAYALNNPLSLVDPLSLEGCDDDSEGCDDGNDGGGNDDPVLMVRMPGDPGSGNPCDGPNDPACNPPDPPPQYPCDLMPWACSTGGSGNGNQNGNAGGGSGSGNGPMPMPCQVETQNAINNALPTSAMYIAPTFQLQGQAPGLRNGNYNYNYFLPNINLDTILTATNGTGRFHGGLHFPQPGGTDPITENYGYGIFNGQNGLFITAHFDTATPTDDLISFFEHLINDVILKRGRGGCK
jgi:RHS repeat-associated protein